MVEGWCAWYVVINTGTCSQVDAGVMKKGLSPRTMHFVSVYHIAQAQLVAAGSQLVGTVAALGVTVDGAADGRHYNIIWRKKGIHR